MKVATLTIWTPHDASSATSVHTTSQGAFQTLVQWLKVEWDEEVIGRRAEDFASDDEMVDCFFDLLQADYQYEIEEKTVYGPDVAEEEMPKLGPDEVLLSPEEVEATILALGSSNPHEMAENLGKKPGHYFRLANTIIKKLQD